MAKKPEQRAPVSTSIRPIIWSLALCVGIGVVGLALGVVAALNIDRFTSKPITPKAHQAAHAELPPLPPPPKIDEPPDGPAPPDIDAEARRKVIRATAYLKVTRAAGLIQEGTGFFAAEPGLVITSAHVVGMGASGCSAPANVEVVLNRGEKDEVTLQAHVLGADFLSDLAVLRIVDLAAKLPPPLSIGSSQALNELQKVYILGFPLGAGLGKNITVTESSVSTLRKSENGTISQIQVASNILPGNSGGPVVDSRGRVVGMAVAFLGGRQLGYAVPGEKVNDLLRGRVQDLHLGEPIADKDVTRLPVTVSCLDPLQRLRDLQVDIWAGRADAVPPVSFKKPDTLPGDGPRQTIPVEYKNGAGSIEVVLPALNKDQVLWVQPVLTDGGGASRWAAATNFRPSGLPPLQRVAADIRLRFAKKQDWTVKIELTDALDTTIGMNKVRDKKRVEVSLLERAQNDDKQGEVRLFIGPCKTFYENETGKGPGAPQIPDMLRGQCIQYRTDLEGTWQNRNNPGARADADRNFRIAYNQLVNDIANSYESTCFAFPNRLVQPRETWPARLPLLTAHPFGGDVITLVVTCTYEGCRMVDGENHAVLTMAGNIEGTNPPRTIGGTVRGKFHVALDNGCVSKAEVKIEHLFGAGNVFTHRVVDVALTRRPGNTLGIQPTGQTAVAKGKTIFETGSTLDTTDRTDLRAKCFAKKFPVKLEAGRAYVIEMNRLGIGMFDPYLVLRDPEAKLVAEDDDSGGEQNARIVYTPTRSGVHEICATTCDPGQAGAFRLIVVERPAEKQQNEKKSNGKP